MRVRDEKLTENPLRFSPPPVAQNVLIVITAILSMTIIVANYAAVKIWDFCDIPVDGGLILFPLAYVLGDILSEIYGRRTADIVAWSSAAVGLFTMGVMWLVASLPDYLGADNAAFVIVSGMTGRIFFASVMGFLASQLCNNLLFEKIRRHQANSAAETSRQFGWRAFAPSAVAHVPDIVIFEPLAFWGRLSWREFWSQAAFAYVAAVIVEVVLLCFVTMPLVKILARRLKFRHGERTE